MADQGGREDVSEPAVDPVTKDIIRTATAVIYWLCYPVAIALYYVLYYVSFAVLFVAKLLYRPFEFVLLPVIYLGYFILNCLAAPFRFLAKFETLYIYLGIAALVGLSGGLILNYIYSSLHTLLGLNSEPVPPGRTAKQYREDKRKQKVKAEAQFMSPGYFSPGSLSLSDTMRKGNRGKGLISQTILEEVDSEN